MKEVWLDIRNYEGSYQISSLGGVRSVDRIIHKENGKIERRRGKPMSLCVKRDGYVSITLTKDKVATSLRVHRLVAEHFIPNPNNHKAVNHLSGIKTDNSVTNLEWCSLAENTSHAHRIGLSDKKGILHHNCSLDEGKVKEIRSSYGVLNQYELAKKYGISVGHVSEIVNHKKWNHI